MMEQASLNVRQHVNELTGLRGIAALCVLLNHLLVLFPPLKSGPWLPVLKQCGILGMSLFFTLSGFVIFYNYGQRIYGAPAQGIKKFFIARFARLFPLYGAFLLLFFVFNALLAGKGIKELSACAISLPLWILGMQSWFYGFINDIPLIYLQGRASLLWSVSTELTLYCFFIPLCFLLVRLSKAWQIWAALVLISVMHGVYLYLSFDGGFLTAYLNGQFSVHKSFKAWHWLIYYAPTARMFEFTVGCLAAVVYLQLQRTESALFVYRLLAMIMLLGIVVLCIYPLPREWAFTVQPIFIAGFVFCLAQCGAGGLRSRIMVYMGEISYSTYLLQAIWLQLLSYSGENGWVRLGIFAVYMVGTYTLAHIVYTRWEMLARLWVRNTMSSVTLNPPK